MNEVKSNRKKFFIIEDDANILYGLQAKFRIEGFDVEINDGTEEIEIIHSRLKILKPDFIILDLILPSVDGATLLKVLKADEDLKKTCIFTFSHLSDADSKKWTQMLGSDYYYIKYDFVIDEFVDKVRQVIINREKAEAK